MQLLSRRLGCCSCSCSERDCQKWSERYQRPPGPTNWQDRRPVRRSVAAWLSNWTQGVWQLPTTALWYSSRFTVSQPPGSFCIAKLTTLWPRFGEHVSHMHILLNEEKFGQVMALHTSGNGRQGLSLIGSMWYSVVSGIFFNFTKWQDDKSTFYLMNNALEKNISQKKKKKKRLAIKIKCFLCSCHTSFMMTCFHSYPRLGATPVSMMGMFGCLLSCFLCSALPVSPLQKSRGEVQITIWQTGEQPIPFNAKWCNI